MSRIKLAVIFGGNSSEYSVSLHSAGSAINNVNKERYELIMIGIAQDGTWYHYDGDTKTLEADEWLQHPSTCHVVLSPSAKEGFLCIATDGTCKKLEVDCVLPILHGKNGEDGTLQGLLELTQIPYVGCGTTSSAIAMDKEFTHIICEANGIQMAPYFCVHKQDDVNATDLYKEVQDKLTLPVFIKPANAGSSYGISKVSTFEAFVQGLEEAFLHDDKVLIETGIDGFEVGCAVLGNDEVIVGEVDEIDTNKDFFDFDAKYALTNTQIHCPARIDEQLSSKIKNDAKKIFHVLECKGLARVDMFVSSDKKIYFNEINTMPGFTSASRYPTMMSKVDLNFTQLIDRLVDLAMQK